MKLHFLPTFVKIIILAILGAIYIFVADVAVGPLLKNSGYSEAFIDIVNSVVLWSIFIPAAYILEGGVPIWYGLVFFALMIGLEVAFLYIKLG